MLAMTMGVFALREVPGKKILCAYDGPAAFCVVVASSTTSRGMAISPLRIASQRATLRAHKVGHAAPDHRPRS